MSPVSASYWKISGYVIFWGLFAIAFSLFVRRVYFLYRLVRLGRVENSSDRLMHRIKYVIFKTVPQFCSLNSVCLQSKDLAGVGHAFLFWGFCLFFIGYVVFIGIACGLGFSTLLGSKLETIFLSILDIASLLVIVSLVWATFRRYIVKPERLNTSPEAGVILVLIFLLMVLHFCIEGFGFAAYDVSPNWPPLGATFANLITKAGLSQNTLIGAYKGVWWFHYLVILGFMIYIPYSKHLHVLSAPLNMFFKPSSPKGCIKSFAVEESTSFGVYNVQDFTWKHLLDFFSCTECGRCHENCPAQLSGKSLDPREVILDIKKHLLDVGPSLLRDREKAQISVANPGKAIPGEVITEDAIWACVDCGACQEFCPVNIQPMVKIIDMKRCLVLEHAMIPRAGEETLKSIEVDGHPWRGTAVKRTNWAKELDIKTLAENKHIDILYWVGCTSALEERSMKVAAAIAKFLKKAGINFGILGDEESCCGDPARHLGSEYLYQVRAERNIELLKSYQIERIITGCPHCYNTLKHEYRHFGGNFTVVHHTEFIAKLLKEGSLGIAQSHCGRLTYHDPCYLGRFNDVFEPPRQILTNLPGSTLVEMANKREKSFCCGAGGGHLWLKEQNSKQRINEMRTEQALSTKAEIIATACPYCLQMFEDGINAKEAEKSLVVMDIAELVNQS